MSNYIDADIDNDTIDGDIEAHIIEIQGGATLQTNLDKKVDNVFDSEFWLDGQNQITASKVLEAVAPYDCYLVGHSVALKEQRTAGTIDFTVYKNDVALVETDLNIQINASYPLDRTITIAHKTTGFDFAAGDKIQVKATSSS